MSGIREKYDEEFKRNAVKLSYASPKSVRQVAEDLSSTFVPLGAAKVAKT